MMPRCRLCRGDVLVGFDHYIAADGYIWHQVCFRWRERWAGYALLLELDDIARRLNAVSCTAMGVA